MPLKWIPNALTLARCALAFVVGWSILAHSATAPIIPFLLFTAVSATDFLDGYAARRLNAISPLGAFLDPIADKLLVALSLLALCQISFWPLVLTIPTAIIIIRDIAITLLRLQPRIQLPVSKLAKWKTAAEMAGIGGLLFAPIISPLQMVIYYASLILVWLAAALSGYTLGRYIGTLLPDTKQPR